jgi:hypothetical protein
MNGYRVTLFCFLTLFMLNSVSRAEPQFSLRERVSCMQCHVNRTGGGMRNAFGRIYERTRVGGDARGPEDVAHVRPDSVNLLEAGADLRAGFSAVFNPAPSDGLYFSEFRLQEARLHGLMTPLRRNLTIYADLSLASRELGTQSMAREVFALWESPSLSWHVKAGRFFQPFGLRIADNAAFTRQVTGFNFDNSDIGVEAGLDKPPFCLTASVTNGSQGQPETNKGKNGCFRVQYAWRSLIAGGSFSYNSDESVSSAQTMGGPFLGWQWGRLSLLGETDWLVDQTPAGTLRRLAALAEGDLLVMNGLNLKIEHSYYDQDRSVAHNGQTLTRYGVEYSALLYLQLALFYDDYRFIPQNAAGNRDQLYLEAHAFF